MLQGLGWSYDVDDAALSRPLHPDEIDAVEALVSARIETRVPAAYLARRMWFAGLEFYVDARVLVPRSPLAELIEERFQPWLGTAPCTRILEIGTGSGCIAIALAHAFPAAAIDATDISADALAVAAENNRRHDTADRVQLIHADVFPAHEAMYDLIISNPPYVPAARLHELPAEYRAEPDGGLAAGADGMDCVTRILHGAAARLTPGGLLVVEVGEIAAALQARYPQLPFTWIDFARGGEGVFVLTRAELSAAGALS